MTRAEYQAILQPAIDASIDHFISMEVKHGEGIFLKDNDVIKGVGHGVSAIQGLINDDGATHLVGMLNRAFKGVLAELDK